MAEFRYARGRVLESLTYIGREMDEFAGEYAGKSWQEYASDTKVQKLIDRTIENILTAVIEVSGVVLVEKGIASENYTDVMRKIGVYFGFTNDEIDTLSRLAVQRNRLAHRYLNFRWQAAKFYKENAVVLRKLVQAVYDYEKSKETDIE